VSQPHSHIVIIGGGPGGYEAALVAAQLGADVTVIEEHGLGGSCVLTDCVPSKTLIATSNLMAAMEGARACIKAFHDIPTQRQQRGRVRLGVSCPGGRAAGHSGSGVSRRPSLPTWECGSPERESA
jgi:phytoene dehydrogenase-like protein